MFITFKTPVCQQLQLLKLDKDELEIVLRELTETNKAILSFTMRKLLQTLIN